MYTGQPQVVVSGNNKNRADLLDDDDKLTNIILCGIRM
jgi:hypothetical protein